MKLSLSRAAEFMPATGEFDAAAIPSGYSIDSRTLQPGELFFAVRGERLDGHDYVSAALAKGAVAAVVESGQLSRFAAKAGLLVVDDSLVALQRLGAAVRRLWGKPLIGVTGSAGKTTTKEVHCTCAGHAASGAEVAGQSEQSLRHAVAVAEAGAGARDCGHRDGHVARRGDHGVGQAGAAGLRSGDHGGAGASGVLRLAGGDCARQV